MGDMQMVAQQKLQCVLTRFESQLTCGAAVTKMHVILVSRYRHIQSGQTGVNQDVMMSGIRCVVAGTHDFHSANTKLHSERAGNCVSIGR